MCYSAQVKQDYRDYVRMFSADLDLQAFIELYWERAGAGSSIKTARAMDRALATAPLPAAQRLVDSIHAHEQAETQRLQQLLFAQARRLANAQRTLQTKLTKRAQEDARIAADKIAWARGKLADVTRTTFEDRDARIFPGWYAPVLVMEQGRRVIKPMRYQCRPAGKPASYDQRYPGTYNARRDNLEGFWRGQFGVSHGLVVVNAFYENVSRHRAEGRELAEGEGEQSVVLEFRPRPAQDMLVACLWSRWQMPGQPELLSFAAITDEPPAEIAAAGHDRCVIPIRAANIDAWLQPRRDDLAAQYAILDDRERPHYAHRLAA